MKDMKEKIGKWNVIKEVEIEKPGRYYECKCDCGTVAIIPATTLRAGRSTRCKDCAYKERRLDMSIIGKEFGKWLVVAFVEMRNRCSVFKTVCQCGAEGQHYGSDLRSGKSTQCMTCHNRSNARKNTKHGLHGSPEYKVWCSMKSRCENPRDLGYRWYGARGIKVCERWQKFENFIKDMGRRPEGLTIDRIDNDGNYSPANCRWVTHKENCNNR